MEETENQEQRRIALILFTRAPRPGQSKTRLGAKVGLQMASAFHAVCLRDLIAIHQELRTALAHPDHTDPVELDTYVFHPPEDSLTHFTQAGVNLPPEIHGAAQSGDDLGQRMAHALKSVLEGSPAGTPALLVGSDVPLLKTGDLVNALIALGTADVVAGPTEDGGYYLIGMTQPHVEMFHLQGWGGPTVMEQTRAKAAQAGLSLATIDTLPDVDTVEDLDRCRNHPRAGELADRQAMRMIEVLALRLASGTDKIMPS